MDCLAREARIGTCFSGDDRCGYRRGMGMKVSRRCEVKVKVIVRVQ